ncbi:S8 family peptidase [Thalassobius sp. Cn5-15]|uniref:S8 family peptidase n=1 Tax=Thalassobius sp. Cn5-15 TaxID=2917763 RepID=UPI00272AB41C|nr:S8 family peptidase [Thalassobius sp. Cn5-15]
MTEVTSKSAGPEKKKYLIGKPDITPAHLDEVDLERLSLEIAHRTQADFGTASLEGGDDQGQFTMELLRDPETNTLHTLSVELTEQHVHELQERHQSALIIEQDEELFLQTHSGLQEMSQHPVFAPANAKELKVSIKVVDQSGVAVPGARVDLMGEVWSDQQVTNTQGNVTLRLFGETLDSLEELRIKPAIGFWSKIILDPNLALKDNIVTLSALPASLNTPQSELWGNKAVGNVAMPAGNRIRVAVIDSGFADGHPDVSAAGGRGFAVDGNPDEDWKLDDSGHGTHVAGTIGALNNAIGMRGVAEPVDIFPLRVFPKASFSKLIAAIDTAIELNVDVVNMSLGGTKESQLLRQRMQAARNAGILLVAAAGNSGGPVMYPAAYPEVMAVAAIGKVGSFPADSFHSRHVTPHKSQDGQYFSAAFTCYGPEIDVCGPGVAIISTLPGPGFGSYDGTSMASPHVAGVAAALLSLSPAIQGMARNAARSQALFDAVLNQCQSLGLPAERQGSGLPVLRAASTPPPPSPSADESWDAVSDLIRRALEAARAIKENG